MSAPIRLLVIGTGMMARTHAEAFQGIDGCELVAGVDTDAERLDGFCDDFGIANRFASVDEAVSWGGFDAATNVTPDHIHKPTTMPLIAAGKAVLCEKPLAPSHEDALSMADAADAAGVVNMINLTYRNTQVLQKARSLIEDGAIGAVRHVDARYYQSWLVSNHWGDWRADLKWLWRLSTAHGSTGALGDIGVHVLDALVYATGLAPQQVFARLQTFPKVDNDRIGEYTLDANDSATLSLSLENGVLGQITVTRFATGYSNTIKLSVFGTEGGIEARFGDSTPELKLCNGKHVHDQTWVGVELDEVKPIYARFIDAVRDGANQEPSFRHGARLQKVLDLAGQSAGDGAVHSVS